MTAPNPARRANRVLGVIAIGALLTVVVLLAGLVVRPLPATGPALGVPSPTPDARSSSAGGVPRASLEEAKAAFDSGQSTFVDVRSDAEYEAGHISGAVSIPLQDLESRWTELNPDRRILLYCS